MVNRMLSYRRLAKLYCADTAIQLSVSSHLSVQLSCVWSRSSDGRHLQVEVEVEVGVGVAFD